MENNYFNQDWLADRLGRFTASEIHKLFASGKSKSQLFGQGAMTYIRAKAAEILTQEVKDEIDFKQAEWGKSHEPEAVARFEKDTGLRGEYFGASNPKFFPVGDYLGYSPDWVNPTVITDIKCPYNSSEHLKNLSIQSADELKKERWEYYCQLQFSMLHHKSEYALLVSYDPRFVYDWMQIRVIKIYPDQEWIEEYNSRIAAAIDELKSMIVKFANPIAIASYQHELKTMIIDPA